MLIYQNYLHFKKKKMKKQNLSTCLTSYGKKEKVLVCQRTFELSGFKSYINSATIQTICSCAYRSSLPDHLRLEIRYPKLFSIFKDNPNL